jgi:hypothetical protein
MGVGTSSTFEQDINSVSRMDTFLKAQLPNSCA